MAVPYLGPEEGATRGLGVGEGAAQPMALAPCWGPLRSITCLPRVPGRKGDGAVPSTSPEDSGREGHTRGPEQGETLILFCSFSWGSMKEGRETRGGQGVAESGSRADRM